MIVGRGEENFPGFYDTLQNVFTVHRDLLCLRSRFFHTKLERPFDTGILAEALVNIERETEGTEYGTDEDGVTLQERACTPQGYVPSFVSFLYRYRQESRNNQEALPIAVQDPVITIELPTERPRIFRLFIHWLYTGQLESHNAILDEECVYASLYCVAERLDVPNLRHECYSKLREMYDSESGLPCVDLLKIIVYQCSSKCLLRVYMVQLFAHAVISENTDDADDELLDMCPSFHDEVAREITRRLRAREKSQHPYDVESFNLDESDADVESMSEATTEGDSDFEKDHVLYGSDNDDADSACEGLIARIGLAADARETQTHDMEVLDLTDLHKDAAPNDDEVESLISIDGNSSIVGSDSSGSTARGKVAIGGQSDDDSAAEDDNDDDSDDDTSNIVDAMTPVKVEPESQPEIGADAAAKKRKRHGLLVDDEGNAEVKKLGSKRRRKGS